MNKKTIIIISITFFSILLFSNNSRDLLNENFDSSFSIPSGWSVSGTSENDWFVSDALIPDHTTGTGNFLMFYCYNEYDNTTAEIVTPRLVISNAESQLTFWTTYYYVEGNYSHSADLYVDVSVDEGLNWIEGTTNIVDGQEGTGWFQVNVDLTEYIDQLVNIRFRGISDYGSYNIAIDDVFGPSIEDPTEIPGSAVNPIPIDNATNVNPPYILEWQATTGSPNGYKVYMGTDVEPPFIEDIGNNLTYSPANLNFSTTYYWKIVPYNNIGDAEDCPTWSFTTTDDPNATEFPWIEDFAEANNDNWPLYGWDLAEGTLTDNSSLIWDAYGWVSDDFANITDPVNRCARVNIYGTGRNHWMVTPTIDLGDTSTSYELSFDIALTQYSNNNPAELAEDDKFSVVISPDNGTTWSESNTIGSWLYGDAIGNTAENIVLSLEGYSGSIRIGFYGESFVENEDIELFVDNIIISEASAYTPPTNLEVLMSANIIELTWNAPENELFTAFNIYENDLLIDTVPDTQTSYAKDYISGDYFEYYVTAMYDSIESLPSETVTLTIVQDNDLFSDLEKPQLKSIYPNPFVLSNSRSKELLIDFYLSNETYAKINIFNVKGQKVRNIAGKYFKKGSNQVSWNLTDENNSQIDSGVYFYQLRTAEKTITKRFLFIK